MRTLIASIIAALSMPPTQNHNLRRRVRKISGAFGMRSRNNPMHGIVCASPRKPCEQRHIEGSRDYRKTWLSRDYASNDGTFADSNPHPVSFLP